MRFLCLTGARKIQTLGATIFLKRYFFMAELILVVSKVTVTTYFRTTGTVFHSPQGTFKNFIKILFIHYQWLLDKVEKLLNNRPRKCLNYQTLAEVFWRRKICCVQVKIFARTYKPK